MKFENPEVPYSAIPQFNSIPLQPVELDYKKVLYINWTIVFSILIVSVTTVFILIKSLQNSWLIILVALLLVAFILIVTASIEVGYKNKAWALREKDIIFKKGWLFQSTYIIPFIKVQHCIVNSGPIGRRYGLASIKLNTASSDNIDISIHGLKQETADQLKAFIMTKIEADEPEQI